MQTRSSNEVPQKSPGWDDNEIEVLDELPEEHETAELSVRRIDELVPIDDERVRAFYDTEAIGALLVESGLDLAGQLSALRRALDISLGKPVEGEDGAENVLVDPSPGNTVRVLETVNKIIAKAADKHFVQSTSRRTTRTATPKRTSVADITKNVRPAGKLPAGARDTISEAGTPQTQKETR